MVIIDSSVWILALRREFHPRIKALVGDLLDLEEVGINGLIMLEILGLPVGPREVTVGRTSLFAGLL